MGAGVCDSTACSHAGLEVFKLLIIYKCRNVEQKYGKRSGIALSEITSPPPLFFFLLDFSYFGPGQG